MFKRIFSVTGLAVALVLGAQTVWSAIDGTISASRLNVRAQPGTSHTIVGVVKQGQKVRIYKKKDGWYEIEAPKDTSVWVASPFVDENGKVVRAVNMRAGAGVGHSSLGTLEPGVQLKVVNRSRHGWLKIEPPPNTTVWISSKYVDVSEKDLLALLSPKKKKSAEDEKSVKKKAKLAFIKGKRRTVITKGKLFPVKSDYDQIDYVLGWKQADGELNPYAYVICKLMDLKTFEKKNVQVEGVERWVPTWTRPVLEIEKILIVQ